MAEEARITTDSVADDLTLSDLRAALAAGWRDFRAEPLYGLFFAAIYVAGGCLISLTLMRWSSAAWLIPAAAGFPLLAPFTAVGLYEVSRRREAGEAVSWKPVLGALKGHGDEQIMSMGVIIFVAFGFWLMIAHGVFAVFASEFGAGAESFAFLTTPTGLVMLAVGSVIGGVLALAFYAVTVVSLPLLVDKKVDFLTAIIVSLATIRANSQVMLVWALLIAIALALALIPMFFGLFLALPVFGHATWHLYRRVVARDEPASA